MQENDSSRQMRGRKGSLPRVLLLVVGLMSFGAVLYLGGMDALQRTIGAGPIYLAGLLLTTGLITFLGSLRWRALMNAVEKRKAHTVGSSYYFHMVGRAAGLLASRSVGDLVARPLAAKIGGDLSLGKAVYSSVLDKVFDFWMFFLFLAPALLYASGVVPLNLYLLLLLVCILLGSTLAAWRFTLLLRSFLNLIDTATRALTRLPILKALARRGPLARFDRLDRKATVDPRAAVQAQLLTLGKYGLLIIRAYLVALALDLDISLGDMVVAVPVAQASVLLAITPAGLGIQELGWTVALALVGVANEEIVIFLVGQRAYIFLSILALAALTHVIVLLLGYRGRVEQVPSDQEQPDIATEVRQ